MKKMMKIFVLIAVMIIPVSISMAGHVHKHSKHKAHRHYKNHRTLNPAIQGASWI